MVIRTDWIIFITVLKCYPKSWGKSKGIWKWSTSLEQEEAKKKKKQNQSLLDKENVLNSKINEKHVLINMEGQLKWELHAISIHSTDFNPFQNCYKHIN